MNILYIIVVILIIWSAYGYFTSRVEMAEYSVLEVKKGYEIRLYPSHIVAQTTVKGLYMDALNEGFSIVARYIFGGNSKKQSIAMTTPVIEKGGNSESIAMTSPVMANIEGESHVIAFGMPKSYTIETLPVPKDSRVKIVTIPERKMAVLQFSWWRSNELVKRKKQELVDLLNKDKISTKGEAQYAGYNAPWTPPWMVRNEVMIEI